jgi:hypothetical protein
VRGGWRVWGESAGRGGGIGRDSNRRRRRSKNGEPTLALFLCEGKLRNRFEPEAEVTEEDADGKSTLALFSMRGRRRTDEEQIWVAE